MSTQDKVHELVRLLVQKYTHCGGFSAKLAADEIQKAYEQELHLAFLRGKVEGMKQAHDTMQANFKGLLP